MEIDERIVDKILKLKELAERGIDGEMANAKRILQSHLDKYGITLEDIVGKQEEKQKYSFRYSSNSEKSILVQCVLNLFGSESDVWKSGVRYKDGTMQYYFDLSRFEFALLDDLYSFHRNQWKKQLKDMEDKLLMAYLHNQNLWDKTPTNDDKPKKPSKYSMKEIITILAMADSMKTDSYRKSLT